MYYKMNKFPLRMFFFQKRFNYTNTSEYRVYRNMLITTEHKIEKKQNIKNIKKEIKQKLENRKKEKNVIDIFTYL